MRLLVTLLPVLLSAQIAPERGYRLPLIDLAGDTARQVVVDREAGQYLGHPTTVLLEDGQTILAVYPRGHGKGGIVLKRSTDRGRTWSQRLPVPDNWSTSLETPTIHRAVDGKGVKRLLVFSGLYPIRLSVSEDDGTTWTPLKTIGDFGGIVAMSDLMRLNDGRYMAVFHDDERFLRPNGKPGKFRVYKTISSDGGLTWSGPTVIAGHPEAHLCEPGLVRSPDGKQILMLLRENSRKRNSFYSTSDDEGATWRTPVELTGSLTGDRHVARYGPDGRLFVTFRDTTHESPTKGDWVAWVGRYDDIQRGRAGQYRVRLMDNTKGADCCYAGLETLPDGDFLVTTYGHWTEGQPPYVASVRLNLAELDRRARVPIDNAQVRVVHAYNTPGQKSRLHKHDVNRVMVHLDAGRMRLAFENGPANDVPFRAGEVRWDPKGGLHTSENTGGTYYRIVEVELKNPGSSKPAAPLSDPAHMKVEIENDQVRILRVRYGPGESGPAVYALPRVVIYLTDWKTPVSFARSADVVTPPPARYTETNSANEPMEAVVIEIK